MRIVRKYTYNRRRLLVAAVACGLVLLYLLFFFMSPSEVNLFSLVPFGDSPPPISITGTVKRTKASLVLDYQLQDHLGQVKWPSISLKPARKDDLWKTTCLEFFLSKPNSKEYWEVNLSPTGNWNVYHFDDYRDGMKPEERVISMEIMVIDKKLRVILHLTELEIMAPSEPLELGITAVVENVSDGSQTFWALTHTGDQADFHRRDSFILKV